MKNGYGAVMLAGGMLVLLLAVIALASADNQASAVDTCQADRTMREVVVPTDVVDTRELLLIVPRVDVTQLLTYVVPSNSNRETFSYASSNTYSPQPYGRPSNLPCGHNRLPCQAVQMGARGIFSA